MTCISITVPDLILLQSAFLTGARVEQLSRKSPVLHHSAPVSFPFRGMTGVEHTDGAFSTGALRFDFRPEHDWDDRSMTGAGGFLGGAR